MGSTETIIHIHQRDPTPCVCPLFSFPTAVSHPVCRLVETVMAVDGLSQEKPPRVELDTCTRTTAVIN